MKTTLLFCTVLLFSTPVMAQKHIIFVDGYLGWYYSMAPYLSENHDDVEDLPFSGFAVVGNTYTSYTMSSDPNSNNFTYNDVWDEVKSLEGVFQRKTENFLRINLDFPGDFWDDAAWQQTISNFAAVAKAAKNLGFKGILFDDEVYANGQHVYAHYMSNFRFPKKSDVDAHPENYEQWEIDESQENRGDWVDYTCSINSVREENSDRCSYRNPEHSFKEHMDILAARFKAIMEAMEAEFPGITVLVFHGPATAHAKTNIAGHYIKPNSVFETDEFKGAMFLGFKQGLHGSASLHDLGEFYQYNTEQHFQNAYQWRKHDIVSDQYNQGLDDGYRWAVPVVDRGSWSNDVGVGFMVSDYGRPHDLPEYNIPNQCHPAEVESRLNKAINRSDKYVVFYSDSDLSNCENDIRWADISAPVPEDWLTMMQRVYQKSESQLTTLPAIMNLLLAHKSPLPGEVVSEPIYDDPNIPELTGAWYGAMGEHPVRKMTMVNPWPAYTDNPGKNITIFFPEDVAGKKPTVFFIAGWGNDDPALYQALLYFIASQGFNAVFIPGPRGNELGNKDILLTTLDGVVDGPWKEIIDTTKVGYTGHSAGASMVFYLARERANWGTGGRFLFSIASWWGYHLPDTTAIELPENTNMIVQVSHDDADTDPRQNIDFFLHSNISLERKSYLYIPGDADHSSNHSLSYTLDNRYDALDQIGLYRPLESLMRYSFNAPMDGSTWKSIGLPDVGDDNYNTMFQLNGISVLSTDDPLGNLMVPIPAENTLNPSFLCSHPTNNPRREYCMPCKDNDRTQPWSQCQ